MGAPLSSAFILLPSSFCILPLLLDLVSKSLVVVEESGAGTRYRLLETIRQYAAEKLEEAGEAEPIRQRHLEVFTELGQAAKPHLGGPAQVVWLDRLEPELDNLRAALEWVARRRGRSGGRAVDRRHLVVLVSARPSG